jgi:hypothetical protein
MLIHSLTTNEHHSMTTRQEKLSDARVILLALLTHDAEGGCSCERKLLISRATSLNADVCDVALLSLMQERSIVFNDVGEDFELYDASANTEAQNETKSFRKDADCIDDKQERTRHAVTADQIHARSALFAVLSSDVHALLNSDDADDRNSVVGRACTSLLDAAAVTYDLLDERDERVKLAALVSRQCDVWLLG